MMARHRTKAEKEVEKETETIMVSLKDLYTVLHFGEWTKEHMEASKRLQKLVPLL